MSKLILAVLILSSMATLSSCQSNSQTNKVEDTASIPVTSKPENLSVTVCNSPRSQMCTREFRPVCATRDNGVRCVTTPCASTEKVTKSNACTACADEKVFSYIPGACG